MRAAAGAMTELRDAIGATTAMRVAADLRQRILTGEFAPGSRLKIDDIAASCAVSHMPVRGALHVLEREGVLDVLPHRGAVIRPVDARFVRNVYDLRAAIEGMLTERCAQSIDDSGVGELRALLHSFERAAAARKPLAVVRANRDFHDAINRHADNPDAVRVLGQGRLLVEALRVRFGFGPRRTDAIVAEHRQIMRAIAGRDVDKAGRLARAHCVRARDDLLARL
ncbi:MAG: GntR family transcriptional regulator [Betaproteobacteria bacterium]